jgi:hypothetical protein
VTEPIHVDGKLDEPIYAATEALRRLPGRAPEAGKGSYAFAEWRMRRVGIDNHVEIDAHFFGAGQFLATDVGDVLRAGAAGACGAARTGEVIGATWDEINLAERLWIVPA